MILSDIHTTLYLLWDRKRVTATTHATMSAFTTTKIENLGQKLYMDNLSPLLNYLTAYTRRP
jgi:hypothetical protein